MRPFVLAGPGAPGGERLGPGNGDLVKQGQKSLRTIAPSATASTARAARHLPGPGWESLCGGAPKPVIATVLNGRKGNLGQMPTWKDKLDDQQIAAVVTYIRQAWSNRAPAVTPAMVAATRGK